MSEIVVGGITIPQGWETRTQISLLEPVRKIEAPMSLKPAAPAPRTNVILIRRPTNQDVASEASAVLDEVRGQFPGLEVVEESDVTFADGKKGRAFTIAFDAMERLRVTQRHIFRVDDGVFTELTATAAVQTWTRAKASLESMMLSYTPGPSSGGAVAPTAGAPAAKTATAPGGPFATPAPRNR
jgi:hypothetical protein